VRAQGAAPAHNRCFCRKSGNAIKWIILLEKHRRTRHRVAAAHEALDEVPRSLIQNLQSLNQKVK
jgi:hypothetical protein